MNKIKILYAEDEIINYKALIKIMEISGFTVLHAVNGIQAVEFVKNIDDIDIILMDIRMPGIDGYEATKQIKQLKPDLPIIVQTAYALNEENTKILSMGCDDYISKPIEISKLKKMIEKHLK